MLSQRERRLGAGLAALIVIGVTGAIAREYVHEGHQLRDRAEAITGGHVARGQQLFAAYGCGGCHHLNGVPQAQGLVGPPLDTIGARAIIAGKLENNPDSLRRWIENPQSVTPGTAMPNLGVKPDQARDIAAFLYTHT